VKPHHRSLLIGIGLGLGAFLFMGQTRAPAPAITPGRYFMQPMPRGDGVFVVDTATGAVKSIYSLQAPEHRLWGVPFDRLP
jgi:hypothetical protein